MARLLWGTAFALGLGTASAAELTNFDVVYGDLHNHAAYSESEHADAPIDAYGQARENGRVQVYGLSEHVYPRTAVEPDGLPSTGDIPSDSEITPFGPGERSDPGTHPDSNPDQYRSGLVAQADLAYKPGEFVTFYGFEYTTRSSEHLSVFFPDQVFFPKDVDNIWLDFLGQIAAERTDAANPRRDLVFAQVNHPDFFATANRTHPDSERSRLSLLPFSERDQAPGVEHTWDLPAGGSPPNLTGVEVRDGIPTLDQESSEISGEFEEYLNALDSGFKLGVDGSHDTHQSESELDSGHLEHGAQRWKTFPGIRPGESTNDQFTGYLLPKGTLLTREAVVEAIRARRTFVTEDADTNLRVLFEVLGPGSTATAMGGTLAVPGPTPVRFRVQVSNALDPSAVTSGGPDVRRLAIYSNHPSAVDRVLCTAINPPDLDPATDRSRVDVTLELNGRQCVAAGLGTAATAQAGQYFVLVVQTDDVVPLGPTFDSSVNDPQPQRTVTSAVFVAAGSAVPALALGMALCLLLCLAMLSASRAAAARSKRGCGSRAD